MWDRSPHPRFRRHQQGALNSAPTPRRSRLVTRVLTGAVLAGVAAALLPVLSVATAEPAQAMTSGAVLLQNTATGRCADLPGSGPARTGSPVLQHACNETKLNNMRWRLIRSGNHGRYARYLIQNQKSRMCMDLPFSGWVPAGTAVTQHPCKKNNNQYFYAQPHRGGWMFVNTVTRLCLDVAGASPRRNGVPLTLWHCDPRGDHTWTVRAPRLPKCRTMGQHLRDFRCEVAPGAHGVHWRMHTLRDGTPIRGLGANGCTYSPDEPGPFNFRKACALHDYGYALIRAKAVPGEPKMLRHQVDSAFRDALKRTCAPYNWHAEARCETWAGVYYTAVDTLGGTTL